MGRVGSEALVSFKRVMDEAKYQAHWIIFSNIFNCMSDIEPHQSTRTRNIKSDRVPDARNLVLDRRIEIFDPIH